MKNNKGFTLLEILLVVGIIAILAAIVIIAINPSKMLANARDTERRIGLREINSALMQYYIDKNEFPVGLSGSTLTDICNSGSLASGTATCEAGTLDLSVLVPKYITAIPVDPKFSTATSTGYRIALNSSHRVYLRAPNTEVADSDIQVGLDTGVILVADNCSHVATDPDCWSADDITGGQVMWASVTGFTGSQDDDYGDNNTNNIMNYYANGLPWNAGSNYPAITACAQLVYCSDNTYRQNSCPVRKTIIYDDWYLPARQELLAAYSDDVPGFQKSFFYYWSSTEYKYYTEYLAWIVGMRRGDATPMTKDNSSFFVRCLR